VVRPTAGSVEHWLTERYCLYTADDHGRVLRADIHHPPWPVQPAWADIAENTMAAPYGFGLGGDPLLHFARRQDVLIWSLQPTECSHAELNPRREGPISGACAAPSPPSLPSC
jgi:hypothetical protein